MFLQRTATLFWIRVLDMCQILCLFSKIECSKDEERMPVVVEFAMVFMAESHVAGMGYATM